MSRSDFPAPLGVDPIRNRNLALCNMGMFTAYFDASGNGADKEPGAILFVSGFVSSAEKWIRFGEEWVALLKERGVTSPFHMAEFETATKGSEWTYERRQAFLLETSEVIRRHTLKPFSHGVVIADLQRMFREYEIPEGNPPQPFPWCALRVCLRVMDWAGKNLRPDDEVEFVFEKGDLDWGKFLYLAQTHLNILPTPRPKDTHVAFQACDFLAWEHRRVLRQVEGHQSMKWFRGSMGEILRLFPTDAFNFHRWSGMDTYCREHGYKRREPSE
jgi:hypothetical protein